LKPVFAVRRSPLHIQLLEILFLKDNDHLTTKVRLFSNVRKFENTVLVLPDTNIMLQTLKKKLG